jgi:hypothetical protein
MAPWSMLHILTLPHAEKLAERIYFDKGIAVCELWIERDVPPVN